MVTLYIYQQTPEHHLTCHKSMPTTFTLKPSETLRQAVPRLAPAVAARTMNGSDQPKSSLQIATTALQRL